MLRKLIVISDKHLPTHPSQNLKAPLQDFDSLGQTEAFEACLLAQCPRGIKAQCVVMPAHCSCKRAWLEESRV